MSNTLALKSDVSTRLLKAEENFRMFPSDSVGLAKATLLPHCLVKSMHTPWTLVETMAFFSTSATGSGTLGKLTDTSF